MKVSKVLKPIKLQKIICVRQEIANEPNPEIN